MKTRIQIVKTFLSSWLGIILAAQIFVACDKKSGSKSPGVVPPVVDPWGPGTCTGCPSASGVMARTTSQTMDNSWMVQLDLTGQAAMSNYSYQDPKLITYYYGPIMAYGQMQISVAYAQCGIVPGTYTVRTVTPGQIASGVVQNLRLEAISGTSAVGGTRILMTVNGPIYNDQDPNGTSSVSSTNRLGAEFYIESVNGGQVGMSTMGGCSGAINMY